MERAWGARIKIQFHLVACEVEPRSVPRVWVCVWGAPPGWGIYHVATAQPTARVWETFDRSGAYLWLHKFDKPKLRKNLVINNSKLHHFCHPQFVHKKYRPNLEDNSRSLATQQHTWGMCAAPPPPPLAECSCLYLASYATAASNQMPVSLLWRLVHMISAVGGEGVSK